MDGIRGRDGGECLGDGRRQGFLGPGLGPTEGRLELAEGLLDQGPDIRPLVDAQVVEDDDLAGLQGRDQDLLWT
jgi:hypothetical protein